ncbi:DNA-binding FadR family transcriptional regulator [Sphingomonas sp. SORGH_AS802]|nr:DNA-binding FadR family transcriptional regulator [Sphingomonas sp. SORGH_AS_0438]MDR6134545.1 DNA-binding FadR family transcriptional regulator [Sphingomonas sp. SORGH_AS_0802]
MDSTDFAPFAMLEHCVGPRLGYRLIMEKSDKLYRRVTDGILQRLAQGEFPVGSRLPTERELAETYTISRTTVREAMVALEMMGVVEMRKGSGIYVASLRMPGEGAETLDVGAFELLEARRSVEAEVAALAALRIDDERLDELDALVATMADADADIAASERADRDFHLAIAGATGNGAFLAVVTDLWAMRDRCDLARTIHQRARGGGEMLRVAEHRAIVTALRARDAEAARLAMRQHLDAVLEHLLARTESEEIEAVRQRNANLRERIFARTHTA